MKNFILKNFHLIKENEKNSIISRVNEIVEKFSLTYQEITLYINKRLKTSAGQIKYKVNDEQDNKRVIISLSYSYYKEFGFTRILQTLNHELAHLITLIKHNQDGHNKLFYHYCELLGGSNKYNTNEYIHSKKKWHYECLGCGVMFDMKIKIKNTKMKCSKCKNNITNFKIEKIKE